MTHLSDKIVTMNSSILKYLSFIGHCVTVPQNVLPKNISYGDWAAAFLQVMGAPVCRPNLVERDAWRRRTFVGRHHSALMPAAWITAR